MLSEKHPRYGYRRIAAILRQERWSVGKRHIQRRRRANGLRVPPTKRKVVRRGISTGLPTKAAHRGHAWTWDFISDATVHGGSLKMLTILDEHTRECHVLRPECALRAADVLAWLEHATQEHGAPAFLRSDNGPESIAKEVQRWLATNQIRTIYIDPGSPWQNGFVESFHGRLRGSSKLDQTTHRHYIPTAPWANSLSDSKRWVSSASLRLTPYGCKCSIAADMG